MDLESLADFIRSQRESLARERYEYGVVGREISPRAPTEFTTHPVPDDHRVPSLKLNDSGGGPSPRFRSPGNDHVSTHDDDARDEPHPQVTTTTAKEMIHNNPDLLRVHQAHMMIERRAVTAGEQPQSSSVSDSFYNYFPSLNTKKQQILEERRKEYFEYLKNSSPRGRDIQGEDLDQSDDMDEQRKHEKERLAAQFQKSKQKSILNYQIVEARNRRVEEEAQRKKQEYYNELRKQIEDQKRRQETQKRMEKLEDDIMDRKLELEDDVRRPPPPAAVAHRVQQVTVHRKTASDAEGDHHSEKGAKEEENEKRFSYNYFSTSARDSRQVVQPVAAAPNHPPEHKHCCENYKQILEKLETLCRWRDDFVAKKRQTTTEKKSSHGCVLCESGSLKNCNFCDYHETVVVKGRERFEDSFTDSDTDSMKFNPRKELPSKPFRMVSNSLTDQPTPKVPTHSHEIDDEDEMDNKSMTTVPVKETRNASFLNFDDIPLPTQRRATVDPQPMYLNGRTRVPAEEDKVPELTSSRWRLNEMKKVEWKWDIPAVQKHSINKDKPEKVLTQLGAIRKQLQMEQLNLD